MMWNYELKPYKIFLKFRIENNIEDIKNIISEIKYSVVYRYSEFLDNLTEERYIRKIVADKEIFLVNETYNISIFIPFKKSIIKMVFDTDINIDKVINNIIENYKIIEKYSEVNLLKKEKSKILEINKLQDITNFLVNNVIDDISNLGVDIGETKLSFVIGEIDNYLGSIEYFNIIEYVEEIDEVCLFKSVSYRFSDELSFIVDFFIPIRYIYMQIPYFDVIRLILYLTNNSPDVLDEYINLGDEELIKDISMVKFVDIIKKYVVENAFRINGTLLLDFLVYEYFTYLSYIRVKKKFKESSNYREIKKEYKNYKEKYENKKKYYSNKNFYNNKKSYNLKKVGRKSNVPKV